MHALPPNRQLLPPIATILTPAERPRVDAAGEGLYRTIHRDTLDDVLRDLREKRIGAVLVSVARCTDADSTRLASVVREFPRVPAVALLTTLDATTPRAVLSLGQSGVRRIVDVRLPVGWRELRDLLVREAGDDVERMALGQLAIDLAGVPEDCWRFFECLFRSARQVATVRTLATELRVLPSTLMSRFFRAKLPAPKRYLALTRLVRAARLFENPGLSVAAVANHLDYSSPQSFGRHVRTVMRMTAVEFRDRYDGEGMFQHFRAGVVLPHLDTLRRFTPLSPPPGWVAGRESAVRALRASTPRSG